MSAEVLELRETVAATNVSIERVMAATRTLQAAKNALDAELTRVEEVTARLDNAREKLREEIGGAITTAAQPAIVGPKPPSAT